MLWADPRRTATRPLPPLMRAGTNPAALSGGSVGLSSRESAGTAIRDRDSAACGGGFRSFHEKNYFRESTARGLARCDLNHFEPMEAGRNLLSWPVSAGPQAALLHRGRQAPDCASARTGIVSGLLPAARGLPSRPRVKPAFRMHEQETSARRRGAAKGNSAEACSGRLRRYDPPRPAGDVANSVQRPVQALRASGQ